MQVTETSADGLSREYKVVLDAKDVDEKLDLRLQELAQQVRIPGFRPGKVPPELLKKRFGDGLIQEVVQELVNESSQQAIAERGLRPAMLPHVHVGDYNAGKDLEYVMHLELMPDIEPIDFGELELERLNVEVPDSDVDAALENMAKDMRSSKPLETPRPAQTGDVVALDFVGSVDGEEKPGMRAEAHHLELGSGSFIPGFEDQLIGASAGEHRTVTVSFPADYHNAELAGKEAVFEVDVKEVREPVAMAVDEAMAQTMGLESLDALREAVRARIGRDFAGLTRMRLKRQLLDALADKHEFAVPKGMADAEFDAIWAQVAKAREEHPDDPEFAEKSEDDLKAEYRTIAERRVRLGLLLSEVGRLNNIEVSQDDINRAMAEEARRHPGEEQKVFQFLQQNREAQESIRAPLFEDKVVDFIVEMANVSERKLTPDELQTLDSDAEAASEAEGGESAAKTKSKTKRKTAKSKAKKAKS
jgi:trigger factor